MLVALPPALRACRLRPILLYVSVALAAVFPQSLLRLAQAQTATSPSQAGHDSTAARSASIHDAKPEELLQQLGANKLSAEQIATVTAQVLRLQADEKTAWEPRWGEFVARAHQQGKLPADLWYKYLLGAVQLEVTVAAETKRADGLAVWYKFKNSRGARMGLTALSAVGERMTSRASSSTPTEAPATASSTMTRMAWAAADGRKN